MVNGGGFSVTAVKEILAKLRDLVERANYVRNDPQVRAVIQQHQDLFGRHQLRLRPSVGSFSLVSCSPFSPQLGQAGLKTAEHLKRELEGLRSGRWTLKRPGRPTPEKAVQSWLIFDALSNANGEVTSLFDAAQTGVRYWFVSDEIALQEGSTKFVADMLLVKELPDGSAGLVNAELKYQRSMETFKQVETFRQALDDDDLVGLWRNFAEAMTQRQFNWSSSSRSSGMVIWPGLEAGKTARRTTIEKLGAQERIETIGYHGGPFSFGLEHPGMTAEAS
jgi:hypothetical protein